jgi:hypothetical protein
VQHLARLATQAARAYSASAALKSGTAAAASFA